MNRLLVQGFDAGVSAVQLRSAEQTPGSIFNGDANSYDAAFSVRPQLIRRRIAMCSLENLHSPNSGSKRIGVPKILQWRE